MNTLKNQFEITLISSQDRLSKKFWKDQDGSIIKDGGTQLVEGSGQTISFNNLNEFKALIQQLKSNQAIVSGVPAKKLTSPFTIVSELQYKKRNLNKSDNTITRTKKNFKYSKTKNNLLFFDYDYNPVNPYFEPNELITIIDKLVPGFIDAEKLINYSASSYIFDENKQSISDKKPSYHIYFIIPNGSDVGRFKSIVKSKIWLQDLGYIMLSEAGSMLERNKVFDEFVFSPERLDYIAPSELPNNWTQEKPEPLWIDGGLFHIDNLTTLNDNDFSKYQELVQTAKNNIKGESGKVKENYINKEVKKKHKEQKGNKTLNIKKETLQAAIDSHNLYSDFILHFSNLGSVSCGTVLANINKYDYQPMRDPLEPWLGNGKAMFYANESEQKPFIHSFLHGEQKYFLHKSNETICDDAKSVLKKIIKKGKLELLYKDEALDAYNLIKKLDMPASKIFRAAIKDTPGVHMSDYEITARGRANIKRYAHLGAGIEIVEKMNKKHAGVMMGGQYRIMNHITDPVTKHPAISISNITDFVQKYSNKRMPMPQLEHLTTSQSKYWLEHTARQDYEGIVFEPMQDFPDYYNLWQGFHVKPKQGSWEKMKLHIEQVIANGNLQRAEYIKAWVAHLLQFPNKKISTELVLQGGQGTGKNLFVDAVGYLLGQHYMAITQTSHIAGKFNAHLKDKILVFLNEATWGGDKQAAGVLKGLVSDSTMVIEMKGKDAYQVSNYLNIIVASNNEWVVNAEKTERRAYVMEVSDYGKVKGVSYFKAILDEFSNGGREAMMHDLLNMDISNFDLRKIEKTQALIEQIFKNLDPHELWLHEKLVEGCLISEKWENGKIIVTEKKWEDTVISTHEVFEDYLYFCNQQKTPNHRRLVNQSLVKYLKKIFPELIKKRIKQYGKLMYVYIVPELEISRDLFAMSMEATYNDIFKDCYN